MPLTCSNGPILLYQLIYSYTWCVMQNTIPVPEVLNILLNAHLPPFLTEKAWGQ